MKTASFKCLETTVVYNYERKYALPSLVETTDRLKGLMLECGVIDLTLAAARVAAAAGRARAGMNNENYEKDFLPWFADKLRERLSDQPDVGPYMDTIIGLITAAGNKEDTALFIESINVHVLSGVLAIMSETVIKSAPPETDIASWFQTLVTMYLTE